jgi:hypothetical protein
LHPRKDPTQAKGTWLAGIGVALYLQVLLMILRQLVLAAPADRWPVILPLCLQGLLAGCFCTAFWRSRVVALDDPRYRRWQAFALLAAGGSLMLVLIGIRLFWR